MFADHVKRLSRFKEQQFNTKNDFQYLNELDQYFNDSVGSNVEKLQNFAKYVPRQDLTNFIARYEIFKKILNIPGSIIECGVLFGGGLMTFAQLSAILEPVNFERKIIGFDTFSGLTKLSRCDLLSSSDQAYEKAFAVDSFKDIEKCIRVFDKNRFLSHFPKIEIIKGDATKTIPSYLQKNPSTMVSLMYLDFILYKPTKIALEQIVPRMPKGGIIAFNMLNDKHWPGVTKAIVDTIGIRDLSFKRFSFTPYTQYLIL